MIRFRKHPLLNAVNKSIMHSLIHSTREREKKKKIYDPQFIIPSRDFYLESILIYTHINKNRINSVKRVSLINALTSLFVFLFPPLPPKWFFSQYKHESKNRNSWLLEANFPRKRYNLIRDTLRCLQVITRFFFFLFARKSSRNRERSTNTTIVIVEERDKQASRLVQYRENGVADTATNIRGKNKNKTC